VTRDRSLEEFVGGSDAGSESAGSDDDSSEGGATSPDDADAGPRDDCGDDGGDVEPIESTYGWSIDGVACESCGATVESRWRDDGILVCADCKEW